jgi:uncharacterized protein YoxC
MDPSVTSLVRDIFVIVAAGLFSVLCLVLIVLILKLYRPLRDTVSNAAKATDSIGRISGDLAAVSQETAGNVAKTVRNTVEISENVKAGTADLPNVVKSVGEAADSLASVSHTASRIVRLVSRDASEADSGKAAPSGVGTLVRLLRTVFGGSRRSDDSGAEQRA